MGAHLATGNEFNEALQQARKEAKDNSTRKGNAVIAVESLSHNTKAITFSSASRLALTPGGHVSIRSPNGFSRSYTPFKVESNSFTIAVKEYKDGRVSPFLNSLRVDDFVTVSSPIEPRFSVVGLQADHVLFVAGGTGIAPLYSMAQHLLENNHSVRVTMFACFRNRDEVLLDDEVIALAKAHPTRCQLHFIFSRDEVKQFREVSTLSGRFCAGHCVDRVKSAHYAVVCGPPTFGDTVEDVIVANIQISRDNIHVM